MAEEAEVKGREVLTTTPHPIKDLMSQINWSLIILLVFAFAILIAILVDAEVLKRLQDVAYARGVITFLVALSAIALAFMFAYQAFTDEKISDNGFRRGREVLTGIMGILGTIVGFYFGSTDKMALTRVEVDAKQEGSSLIAHVAGGTSPYRVSVSFEPKQVKGIESLTSKDGWVVVPLASAQEATKATFEVIDAKDTKSTKTFELKAVSGSAAPNASDVNAPAPPPPIPVTSPTK